MEISFATAPADIPALPKRAQVVPVYCITVSLLLLLTSLNAIYIRLSVFETANATLSAPPDEIPVVATCVKVLPG